MKYNTKYDRILNNKFEEKQEKQEKERFGGYYWSDWETESEGEMWSTHPFTMLYGRQRQSQKPIRNFYKEIINLSRLCMLDTQNN